MAKTKSGPGRAQGKGRSEGRTTAKGTAGGSRIGRYTTAEESGRYTPPVPKNVRKSPRWMGALILILLLGGVLMILLNYLSVLPGSVTVWYLIGGLVMFFSGFMLATRYH